MAKKNTVIFYDDFEPDFATDGWTSGVSGIGSVTSVTEQARSPTHSAKANSTTSTSYAYLYKDITTPASGKFTFVVAGYLPAVLATGKAMHLVTPVITTNRVSGWIGPHVAVMGDPDGKSLGYYSGGWNDTGYDVPIGAWFMCRVVYDFSDNKIDIYCDAEGGITLRKADGGVYSNMSPSTTYSHRPGVYGENVIGYFDDAGYATHEWIGTHQYQTVAEILGMSDSALRRADFKQTVAEILGAVDSATRQLAMKQAISEVLGIRDSLEARKHVGRLGDLPDHTIQGGA